MDNWFLSSGGLSGGLIRIDLLAVLVESNPWGRGTVASSFSGADTDDLGVDGARDTILELQVHLWHDVFIEDGCFADITDGSRLNHVPDGEPLDGLVLGSASGAIGAADGLDVATSVLVTTVGSSLLNHDCG